jgi:2-polyprenyl-6-hydroxyphenyl methylase/3-demethylubiquinone-9 3-methyltransferase
MTIGGDMRAARRAFDDQPLRTRLFIRGRDMLCPMAAVAREVPMAGRILDIGCGHGLFTALLASGSSQRTIVGVDPSGHKIDIARGSTKTFPNIAYIQGSVLDLNDGPYDAIAILDVLYLVPDDLKRKILAHARKLIKDDGVFLLKTNDTRPRWKYAVVRFEEWMMVKVLRYTLGGELHFRSSAEYLQMLDDAGFTAEVRRLDEWHPVPHRLFVCRPK